MKKFLARVRQWWHCLMNTFRKDRFRQPHRMFDLWNPEEGAFYIGCTCGKEFWRKYEIMELVEFRPTGPGVMEGEHPTSEITIIKSDEP